MKQYWPKPVSAFDMLHVRTRSQANCPEPKTQDEGNTSTSRTSSSDDEEHRESAPLTLDIIKDYFDSKFSELADDMATKNCIEKLLERIAKQETKIVELESKIAVMDAHIDKLKRNNDDLEQYHRRLCLRINGIPAPDEGERETGDQSLEKVKEIFNELGVDAPDVVIDRAHRIGEVKQIEGKRYKQMIVRFTTWRHRSLVYKARKESKKYRIKLDLTAAKATMLRNANEMLKSTKGAFAFADINCRLCAKIGPDFFYFSTENELIDHLHDMRRNGSSVFNESGTSEFETY